MKRLPWILLMLSVLFNFFFAGGFLHARSEWQAPQTQAGAADLVAERLGLDEAQRQAFADLKHATAEKAEEIRQAIFEARRQVHSGVGAESVDREKLSELMRFEAEQRMELRLLAGEHLRKFVAVLRPEQRRKLAEMLASRPGPGRGPLARPGQQGGPWGGGPDAREAFRKRMEEFRRGRGEDPRDGARDLLREAWERRREELIQKFDADGDGALNEQEMQRARQFLRERPGSRPGPDTRVGPRAGGEP